MKKKIAFSLIELLITLIIIAFVTAAFAPVFTKKTKTNMAAITKDTATKGEKSFSAADCDVFLAGSNQKKCTFKVPSGVREINVVAVGGGCGGGSGAKSNNMSENYSGNFAITDSDKLSKIGSFAVTLVGGGGGGGGSAHNDDSEDSRTATGGGGGGGAYLNKCVIPGKYNGKSLSWIYGVQGSGGRGGGSSAEINVGGYDYWGGANGQSGGESFVNFCYGSPSHDTASCTGGSSFIIRANGGGGGGGAQASVMLGRRSPSGGPGTPPPVYGAYQGSGGAGGTYSFPSGMPSSMCSSRTNGNSGTDGERGEYSTAYPRKKYITSAYSGATGLTSFVGKGGAALYGTYGAGGNGGLAYFNSAGDYWEYILDGNNGSNGYAGLNIQGSYDGAAGAGGYSGGLVHINKFPVTPGEECTIYVGLGGAGGTVAADGTASKGAHGGESSIQCGSNKVVTGYYDLYNPTKAVAETSSSAAVQGKTGYWSYAMVGATINGANYITESRNLIKLVSPTHRDSNGDVVDAYSCPTCPSPGAMGGNGAKSPTTETHALSSIGSAGGSLTFSAPVDSTSIELGNYGSAGAGGAGGSWKKSGDVATAGGAGQDGYVFIYW